MVTIITILLSFALNMAFIQKVGSYGGLYMNGLIFEQWVICYGMSMILWVIGIITRLFPNLRK